MNIFRRNHILSSVIIAFLIVMFMLVRALPIHAAPSIFDWDTNLWPVGSLSQTYTGIGLPPTDFIFTFTGDTRQFEYNSPATNQVVTGGISPPQNSLFIAADFSSNTQSITLTIDLSLVAGNVSFLVMDIDHPIPDGSDKIVVTGLDGLGSTVLPTLTATDPSCVNVVENVATGLCLVDNTQNNGNVSVSFNTTITKIIIEFQEGFDISDPGSHGVGIFDISFDPIPSTPTDTPTQTQTYTQTPIPTDTLTPTPTSTSTSTPTDTSTPTKTLTATPTRTSTSTPTGTVAVSPTSTATITLTPTTTRTPFSTPTATSTQPPIPETRIDIYLPIIIEK